MFNAKLPILYMYRKGVTSTITSTLPLLSEPASQSMSFHSRYGVNTLRASALSSPLLTSACHFSTPGKVKVNLTTQDGTNFDMECEPNQSLMNAIRDEHQLEMAGYCEGKMECCTCLVHLSEKWYKQLGPPSEQEQDTIDKSKDKDPFPRLSCQIKLTPEMNGLEATMPKEVTCLLWETS